MPTFLNTPQIVTSIYNVIKNAKQQVILISPYIQISNRNASILHQIDRAGVKIVLVFGKCILNEYEENFLLTLNNLELRYLHNLHAKCYANEADIIISSKNLYEASERNVEMGVLINAINDPDLFNNSKKEVVRIVNVSEVINRIQIPAFTKYVVPVYTEHQIQDPVLSEIARQYNRYSLPYQITTTVIDTIPYLIFTNWLGEDTELRISQAINLAFYNHTADLYNELKTSIAPKIQEALPDYRIYCNKYFNRAEISVYPNGPHENNWHRQAWIYKIIASLSETIPEHLKQPVRKY